MDKRIEDSKYAKKAMELFKEGYNCSQAVFLAFEDKYKLDRSTALKISSSFGGGMGRLREVCGSVTGMFMVAGMLYGYDSPKDNDIKMKLYSNIQNIADEFKQTNGSIVCRELLGGLAGDKGSVPDKRTEEYYKKRPCVELVGVAAAIMEEFMKNN